MSTKGSRGKESRGGEIKRAIWARGMTVSGWSRVHGHKIVSVFKIIHGTYGNPGPVGKAILKNLKKDGLLKKNPGGTRVRKSA